MGSEGKGVSRLVREACDAVAGIPISDMVESLNASVAAGISLYAVCLLYTSYPEPFLRELLQG